MIALPIGLFLGLVVGVPWCLLLFSEDRRRIRQHRANRLDLNSKLGDRL